MVFSKHSFPPFVIKTPLRFLSEQKVDIIPCAFFLICYTTKRSRIYYMFHTAQNSSLGSLESEVMETLWKLQTASVRAVVNLLQKKREIAYTTVMTIMSRLCAKGLLERSQNPAGAYLYSPKQTKAKFLEKISEKIIKNLLKNCGEVAVARFIDIIEAGNSKKSAEWRKKLKKVK